MFKMGSPKPALVCLLGLSLSSVVWACQVPVFRYALERWQADPFQVLILSDGPLSAEVVNSDWLAPWLSPPRGLNGPQPSAGAPPTSITPTEETADRPRLGSQVVVKVVDINDSRDSRLARIWQQRTDKTRPVLAALYPAGADAAGERPAFVAPLTRKSLQATLASPVREQIAANLMAGDSAVWILLESGDKQKDQAAYAILEKQLLLDADWLELPSPAELEVEPEVLTQAKIPLRIQFSIVRLSRDDAAEAFLVESLLNSESDLQQFDDPMAFPVFGRGRVLYALVGPGIAADTIRRASAFMVGPCSCQVKNQNPGFDLLLQCDWDQAVGDTFISEPIESLPTEAEPVLLQIPPGRSPSR